MLLYTQSITTAPDTILPSGLLSCLHGSRAEQEVRWRRSSQAKGRRPEYPRFQCVTGIVDLRITAPTTFQGQLIRHKDSLDLELTVSLSEHMNFNSDLLSRRSCMAIWKLRSFVIRRCNPGHITETLPSIAQSSTSSSRSRSKDRSSGCTLSFISSLRRLRFLRGFLSGMRCNGE